MRHTRRCATICGGSVLVFNGCLQGRASPPHIRSLVSAAMPKVAPVLVLIIVMLYVILVAVMLANLPKPTDRK